MADNSIAVRRAQQSDCPLILDFIKQLAHYEKLSDQVVASVDLLQQNLFGEKANAHVLIGEVNGEPKGFALYFYNFSTFLGRKGLYLEDLFVAPDARGVGLGKLLLAQLAQIAVEQNCGRFEWCVLDWNKPAIDFYLSLGAQPLEDWTIFRVTGEAMQQLALQSMA